MPSASSGPPDEKGRCRLHRRAHGSGGPPGESGMGNTVTASGNINVRFCRCGCGCRTPIQVDRIRPIRDQAPGRAAGSDRTQRRAYSCYCENRSSAAGTRCAVGGKSWRAVPSSASGRLVFRLIHLHPTARLARVFFARWRLRMMDLAVAVHMKGFGCAFR
jgi:hypothetical protein